MLHCILTLHNASCDGNDVGVAHLDIKPDNFIMNDDLTISAIDFGHSQPMNVPLRRKVGTIQYLAPELKNPTRNISIEKADVYSLAVTLKQIMTNGLTREALSEYPLSREFAKLINFMAHRNFTQRPNMR